MGARRKYKTCCIPLDKRAIKQQKSDSRKILAKATLECISVHAYFERLRFRCSRSRACCCRTIFDLSCIQQFWRADCSIEHTSHFCVLQHQLEFISEHAQKQIHMTLTFTAAAISEISSPMYSLPVPLNGILVLTILTKTPILSCAWFIL